MFRATRKYSNKEMAKRWLRQFAKKHSRTTARQYFDWLQK